MGNLENRTIEELEKMIKDREEWFKEIINFVEQITRKRGKVIKEKVNSSNTHVERELKDFGGFDFFYSTGESMMGGNTVHISQWRGGGPLVFVELWWQADLDTPEVKVWKDDPEWQKELKDVMVRQLEIAEKIDKKLREQKAEEEKKLKDDKHKKELIEKAKKLKLRD